MGAPFGAGMVGARTDFVGSAPEAPELGQPQQRGRSRGECALEESKGQHLTAKPTAETLFAEQYRASPSRRALRHRCRRA